MKSFWVSVRSIHKKAVCFFIAFYFLTFSLEAQPIQIQPKKPIICYESGVNKPDHIPPPKKFLQWRENRSARMKTANFEVEYIGFPADNLAKNAFQFAVDIWETQITSPVTIRIRAQWASLASGVLGQAIWGTAFANFDGAQHLNTFYPVALAEKMAARDLNTVSDADIVATFSSTTNWYFGTDGNTPPGKMDMVTIVLHEIAHGLGFSDTYDGATSQGSVGLENGGATVPFVYDLFVENGSNQSLFTSFVSPSSAMRTQLISNNIFYNSPLAKAGQGGNRPKLYAPNPFDGGSSIAHLNEGTFTTPGDANNLMTPQIAFQESIHTPGSILLNIFSDMGWVFTKIGHEPLKDTERKDGLPYIVTVKISSDNGYDPAQVILNYTTNGMTFTPIVMSSTGTANEFTAPIPGITTNGNYGYFISVNDVINRTFTNPGKAQTQNQPAVQDIIVFNIGPDTDGPEIAHTPVDYVFEDETQLELAAVVTDNIGVDNVFVEYTITGGATQTIQLAESSSEEHLYEATIILPASLVIGDKIKYRILARDNSSNANQKTDPLTDFFTVVVTGIMPTQDSYVNNFNTESFDFIGNSFSVTTPGEFDNGAIHSEHPYEDGSGPDDESNYIYQLQIPIVLNSVNPYIQFDEIVLVEPGEDGSEFGDADFFDYVVVEGSKDGGITWIPFADGYDSRSRSVWKDAYNDNITNNNSQRDGEPNLFIKRTINMLEESDFEDGEEVLIRFRLYADQAAHGWGWAIDNLSIQGPVTGSEQSRERIFQVYPNPATDNISVEWTTLQNEPVRIQIINLQGQLLFEETLKNESTLFMTDIDVSAYSGGLYLIKAECGDKVVRKKFFKER